MAISSATKRIVYIIIALVVLLVILGVVAGAAGWIGGGDRGVAVETAPAETRTITQVVTASGKVQPEVEVVISPDVSGEIIQLTIREGDPVQEGDLLARIKPDFYAAQVEQAEAGVMQSKATEAQRRADMLNAKAELQRQQDLYEKEAISKSAYEQAQTQYEVAKAAHEAAQYAVQSAEAQLRERRENLSKTAIYAPMTGTVSKLDVEAGERVVGTGQMQGTEMMRIARLDQMELEIDVNENDVVNVAVGDTAAIEVDAYPEQAFEGVVTEIANSARVSAQGTQEQVTNFPVKIRILDAHNVDARRQAAGQNAPALAEEVPPPDTPYPNFRPGMSGTVDIFTRTVVDVVAVPIQAVTVRDFNQVQPGTGEDDGEADATEDASSDEATEEAPRGPMTEDLRKVVFLVSEDDLARMVEVETGISDDTHIQVKRGLDGGESVIIGPYRAVSRTLSPGDAVEVDNERFRPGGNTVADAQP
ncbi:MAG: efflux RND transporter periplasmic adaptor subunit [Bacteroidetes bacterium]|jgi:HlyD family secretion protein|nr:efflux RND transporter periplasmic adaptor subunit [Bacteroidota bacterium]